MKSTFGLSRGALVEVPGESATVVVFAAPDETEKRYLTDVMGIDPYNVDSAVDPDEVPRLEYAPERVSLILKRPKSATVDELIRLGVGSLGLFLVGDKLVIVADDVPLSFASKEFQGASSPSDVLLRVLLHVVRHYVGHLKAIRQLSTALEAKISASMENRYLLQMFALSENLVYYLDAIEANGAALGKLRSIGERIGLTREQLELLDDILLDNNQCARQAQIYSAVLSGLMDARGTIVNNNMNVLLKNLTVINIIFLPLNLIASIGGMSEFTMMTAHVDWRLAYALFSVAMIVVGWVTWVVVVRLIEKSPGATWRRLLGGRRRGPRG